jgi:hypothetical protein
MKIHILLVALTLSAGNLLQGKEPKVASSISKAVRIEVKMKDVFQWHSPGTRIRFFVQTDSTDVPIICMGDNAHFPAVTRYSARERKVDGKSGVVVDVYFSKPVSVESHKKAALAINLWQPNLRSHKYPVLPTDGKKIYAKGEKTDGEQENN